MNIKRMFRILTLHVKCILGIYEVETLKDLKETLELVDYKSSIGKRILKIWNNPYPITTIEEAQGVLQKIGCKRKISDEVLQIWTKLAQEEIQKANNQEELFNVFKRCCGKDNFDLFFEKLCKLINTFEECERAYLFFWDNRGFHSERIIDGYAIPYNMMWNYFLQDSRLFESNYYGEYRETLLKRLEELSQNIEDLAKVYEHASEHYVDIGRRRLLAKIEDWCKTYEELRKIQTKYAVVSGGIGDQSNNYIEDIEKRIERRSKLAITDEQKEEVKYARDHLYAHDY